MDFIADVPASYGGAHRPVIADVCSGMVEYPCVASHRLAILRQQIAMRIKIRLV